MSTFSQGDFGGFGGQPSYPPPKSEKSDEEEESEEESENENETEKGPNIQFPLSDLAGGRIPERRSREYEPITRDPVPSQITQYNADNFKDEDEFKMLRYSAATCDPNDFKDSGFTLRQPLYESARETKLFIVITMYNEDRELFYRSLRGVFRILLTLQLSRTKHGTGQLAESCNPSPDVGEERIANVPPIQLPFGLKEQNQKRSTLIDGSSMLLDPSYSQMFVSCLTSERCQDQTPSIICGKHSMLIPTRGACGEIVAMKGNYGANLFNPLVAAQNFEYKMSNILDKPLESVLGYITVLPGAFSAYRYEALQNDKYGEGPLQKYFMGDLKPDQKTDIFTANMYLAEDRVGTLLGTCVEARKQWILHYVKSAYAETDVPDKVEIILDIYASFLMMNCDLVA
ncbi:chitin synthase N-terminal-domain-containing protein [Cyathus striatus]|nr:chitin synthase N-terminal-domain-containing protein [Cyathus striatus]